MAVHARSLNARQRALLKRYEDLTGIEPMLQDDLDAGFVDFAELWRVNVEWIGLLQPGHEGYRRMSDARYNVLTWDPASEHYTEQEGMEHPCLDVDLAGLRRALWELRRVWGYTCHRVRDSDGHYDGDPAVLVERVDDLALDVALKSLSPIPCPLSPESSHARAR